jgi:hypothetical protein
VRKRPQEQDGSGDASQVGADAKAVIKLEVRHTICRAGRTTL